MNAKDGSTFATIILAAGKGTRMNSSMAKVLHPVGGKPMIHYAIDVARRLGSEKIVVVVGHQADRVKQALSQEHLVFAEQKEQRGTGHAILMTEEALRGFRGTVMILCGDVPLLTETTLKDLLVTHRVSDAAITVMTTLLDDPSGYGRVVKDKNGLIMKIVEERDADEEMKSIREINTGIYCVETPFLFEAVHQIRPENAQSEYYLTDIVEIALRDSAHVQAHIIEDSLEAMGINTKADLEKAHAVMAKRLLPKC